MRIIGFFLVLAFCAPMAWAVTFSLDALKGSRQVAILIAGAKGMGPSSFGHAYLRFSKDSHEWSFADPVLEFAADLQGEPINLFRGLGLGTKYPARATLMPYYTVVESKAQNEERDLHTYVLDLSEAQIDSLLEQLERVSRQVNSGNSVSYAFFSQNCSTLVADLLNPVLPVQISGLQRIVPTQLPEALRNAGLIREEFTDLSAKNERKSRILEDQIALSNSARQALLHGNSQDRLLVYLQLLNANAGDRAQNNQGQKAPANGNALEIERFVRQLVMVENTEIRDFVFAYLSNRQNYFFKILDVPMSQDLVDIKIHSLAMAANSNVLVTTYGGKRRLQGSQVSRHESRVSLDFLRADPHGRLILHEPAMTAIETNDIQIGFVDSGNLITGVSDLYIPSAMIFNTESRNRIQLTLLIDKTAFAKTSVRKTIQDFDLPAISNREIDGGVCLALSLITRMSLLNARYLPNYPRRSSEFYENVLLSLAEGYTVLVPGYANLFELTNDLRKEGRLLDLLKRINGAGNSFTSRFMRIFEHEKFGLNQIDTLVNLLKIGVPMEVQFLIPEINGGHSIVVYDFEETDTEYKLHTYDPNWKLLKSTYRFLKTTGEFQKADGNNQRTYEAYISPLASEL